MILNTVCCPSALSLFICFSFHEVLFCCHLPDKPLFILQCSLQVSPPPWSPPWLPLIYEFFCPLNWASLEALESIDFLFSSSPRTAGHECETGFPRVSHCCFKIPFLVSIEVSISLHGNMCHQILPPPPLLLAVISYNLAIFLHSLKNLTSGHHLFASPFLLISVELMMDPMTWDIELLAYLHFYLFLAFYPVLNPFQWGCCSHHYNKTVVVTVARRAGPKIQNQPSS